jgi:putative nucleotidyltransferase with HDIG domain
MRDVARAEWDEKEQRTTRVEGAVRDITARRLAQERQREMLQGAIEAVSRTSEARDPYTAGHQRKVAELAGAIAEKLELGGEIVEELRTAGLLHDVGKISVPAGILDKPSKLSDVEYELAKTHVNVSYDILKEIPFANGVAHAVLHHHKRLDGSGYPDGPRGDEIVLEARILAVADVVEAMSSHRPYRPALGIEAALEEIDDGAGTRYDQSVAEACTKLFESEGFAFSESS